MGTTHNEIRLLIVCKTSQKNIHVRTLKREHAHES